MHPAITYQVDLPPLSRCITTITDMKRAVSEDISRSMFMEFTPMTQARSMVMGITNKHVCMHLSRVRDILIFILSFTAISIATGSMLSSGRIIRLRNVCDTSQLRRIPWILAVANSVLKATNTTEVIRVTIAPVRERAHSSKVSSL